MSLYIRRSPSPASTQGPPASSRRPIAKLQAKKRSEGSGITGFDFLFAMYGNARFPTQFLDPVIATPDECGGALRYCDALRLRGVLCKDTHDHTIRVSPPLVITRDEIDWALDQFEAALTHREVAAPARPNASSRPARRLRSASIFVFMSASAEYLRREVQMATFRSDSSITSVRRQTSLLFGRLPRSRPCSLSTPCSSSGRVFTAHRSVRMLATAIARLKERRSWRIMPSKGLAALSTSLNAEWRRGAKRLR